MARIVIPARRALVVTVLALSVQAAGSQNPSPNPFGIYRGNSAGAASTPAPRKFPAGVRSSAPQSHARSQKPVGTITDTGFAGRLGRTVGTKGWPSVALPPGVSNINHPGLQPMPSMQPLPTGHSSINSPGIPPAGGHVPTHDPQKNRRHGFGGRSKGVTYYSVPLYVPYYVYVEDYSGSATVSNSGYGDSLTSPDPDAPVLTLLAFKDSSIVLVVEYWLEGDWLYYITHSGHRLSGPLDRLDQPLTQQLNSERNVPFILESRR